MAINRTIPAVLAALALLLTLTHSQTVGVQAPPPLIPAPVSVKEPIKFTIFPSNFDMGSQGTPWLTLEHGFNYVAFDGWTCDGPQGKALDFWVNPTVSLGLSPPPKGQSAPKPAPPQGPGSAMQSSQIRKSLQTFAKRKGVRLLVNAFSSFQNPATSNKSAQTCANALANFISTYGFDGANIDFRDIDSLKQGRGIPWINQFILTIGSQPNRILSLSLDASLYNLATYPNSNPIPLQKSVGDKIAFYILNYFDTQNAYSIYSYVFQTGDVSVESLSKRGLPLHKIVVGKTAQYDHIGFVNAKTLLNWMKKAQKNIKWDAGVAISPIDWANGVNRLEQVVVRRDTSEPVIGTNLDSVNSWWPPEKTASDIGVPSFAPNTIYNYLIFGTWTCQNGAFDIAKLWDTASFFLGKKFGATTPEIQAFLKEKYNAAGKKIVVRAFGTAQSPTSAKQDPSVCARSLAAFVIKNNLDGVDVSYQDNVAFNSGTAETWLMTFTAALRSELPFHIISHTIQGYYLNQPRYPSGGYQKVVTELDQWIDFYPIVYYGQQHTQFNTYKQLFQNSGAQIPEASVFQLLSRGFRLNKIVIAKPVRLFDAQGAGFVNAQPLRDILMAGHKKYKWRAGVIYSSYVNDKYGTTVLKLMRGMNRADSIRLAYVNNVNTWWPPKSTLAEMGVPSLAPNNLYNYFAYAFWTCKEPLAIVHLWQNTTKFFGTELGATHQQTQAYIRNLYKKSGNKLLISTFGDTQFPATEGYNPLDCAKKLGQFIMNNQADGVDIDFQDSQSFFAGTGQNWLILFMQQLRKELPFHIVSHAPQGPYFSPGFSKGGAYLGVHREVGNKIDFYNVQFYNQGNTTYDTYDSLFVQSNFLNPQTAVYELMAQGIQPQKIVLGKPVTQADAYNTGFVEAAALNKMLKEAKDDKKNQGWRPNVMFWHFLSDKDGHNIAQVMQGI